MWDHEQIRQVLNKLIQQRPDLSLSGEATSAEDALEQLPHCQPPPDIVLVDLMLPNMTPKTSEAVTKCQIDNRRNLLYTLSQFSRSL